MLLGDMIAELRRDRNLNQKVLAQYLRVSVATISHYESSVNYPDAEMLIKIADFFGVSVDYLLGRTKLRMDFNLFKRRVKLPDGSFISADAVLNAFLALSDASQVDLVHLMELYHLRDNIRHNEIIRPICPDIED